MSRIRDKESRHQHAYYADYYSYYYNCPVLLGAASLSLNYHVVQEKTSIRFRRLLASKQRQDLKEIAELAVIGLMTVQRIIKTGRIAGNHRWKKS